MTITVNKNELKECPRCHSLDKTYKGFPYTSKNTQCRNGWHNVGKRTMPRYTRSLGRSPLTFKQDIECRVDEAHLLPNVPSVKDKLQSIYNICSPIGQKHILDIARQLGVELKREV